MTLRHRKKRRNGLRTPGDLDRDLRDWRFQTIAERQRHLEAWFAARRQQWDERTRQILESVATT